MLLSHKGGTASSNVVRQRTTMSSALAMQLPHRSVASCPAVGAGPGHDSCVPGLAWACPLAAYSHGETWPRLEKGGGVQKRTSAEYPLLLFISRKRLAPLITNRNLSLCRLVSQQQSAKWRETLMMRRMASNTGAFAAWTWMSRFTLLDDAPSHSLMSDNEGIIHIPYEYYV